MSLKKQLISACLIFSFIAQPVTAGLPRAKSNQPDQQTPAPKDPKTEKPGGTTEAKPQTQSGNAAGNEDKSIETQMLAELAARNASVKLAEQICESIKTDRNSTDGATADLSAGAPTAAAPATSKKAKLVIGNDMDFAEVNNYLALYDQIEILKDAADKTIKDAKDAKPGAETLMKLLDNPPQCGGIKSTSSPGLSMIQGISAYPTAVGEITKSVIALVNLFRTETVYENQEVRVTEQMAATYLAGAILKGGCNCVDSIYYPALYSSALRLNKQSGNDSMSILNLIGELRKLKADADKLLKDITEALKGIKENKTKIDELEKSKTTPDRLQRLKCLQEKFQQEDFQKLIAVMETIKSNLELETKSIGEILSLFTQSLETQSKLSAMATVLRAEWLANRLKELNTYVIMLGVTAAGSLRTRKNLWWNEKRDYTGGVSFTAQLFANDNRMVGGFAIPSYIDYTKADRIRTMVEEDPPKRCQAQ